MRVGVHTGTSCWDGQAKSAACCNRLRSIVHLHIGVGRNFANQTLGRLIHMKPLPLLLTVLAGSLGVACASAPHPETERLTSEIVSNSLQSQACSSDEIPTCRTTATRINSRYAQKICGCLLRDALRGSPASH